MARLPRGLLAGAWRTPGPCQGSLTSDRVASHTLLPCLQVREGDWKVAPLPRDLLDRRVEITGPTDAKMVINALNSGASVYMADFEDSNCPTWANTLEVGM